MVSMVTGATSTQWPGYTQWTNIEELTLLREVLQKLDALDKKLGAKECPEDAAKVPFLKGLDERIKKLEQAACKHPLLQTSLPPKCGECGKVFA